MQLGSVGLAVDAPTLGRSLGPWPTARGQPLTGGPRIPLGLCVRAKHFSVSTQKEPPWLAPKKTLVGMIGTQNPPGWHGRHPKPPWLAPKTLLVGAVGMIGDPVTPSFVKY